MSLKLLVTGDVEGKFSQLFSRVAVVDKKNGPFEVLLCVGNFFGHDNSEWKQYLDGTEKAPIPTYILGPSKVDHIPLYGDINGSELCHNVTYLGKKGLLSAGGGLQIAYLSGIESKKDRADNTHFCSEDVKELQIALTNTKKQFKGVDILLTSQWPKGISKFAGKPTKVDPEQIGSALMSQLAANLLPRYHFSGLEGESYERLPYRNHQVLAETPKHVTRFIALARVGNSHKAKWLYAFSMVPLEKMEHSELTKQPPDVTECPYSIEATTSRQISTDKPHQYFYDMRGDACGNGASGNKRPKRDQDGDFQHRKKQFKTKLLPKESCWFCLSNPEVEKHLVVSVGDHTYLALAKGGLVPEHVLILPIGHCNSTVNLDEEALEEIARYKDALKNLYRTKGCTAVTFERNYRSHHLQIQVVPIPLSKEPAIKQIFQDVGDSQSLEMNEIPAHSDLKQIVHPGAPFFYVELPSGEKLLHRIRTNFPLQFGRDVLASKPLLNLPDKVDWRACSQTAEEESKAASNFRELFKSFDFTL